VPFSLPELPYFTDALAPHISEETLELHHGKHHAGYVAKLVAAAEGTLFAELPVEELVVRIDEAPPDKRDALWNNGAQHHNHCFYWKSLSPRATKPSASLAAAIERDFGGAAAFATAFTEAAAGHFGSGWVWLVKDAEGTLRVVDTHDADTPIAHGLTPLLACDLWEHAYYVDYQNERPAYVAAFLQLADWDFASANLADLSGGHSFRKPPPIILVENDPPPGRQRAAKIRKKQAG